MLRRISITAITHSALLISRQKRNRSIRAFGLGSMSFRIASIRPSTLSHPSRAHFQRTSPPLGWNRTVPSLSQWPLRCLLWMQALHCRVLQRGLRMESRPMLDLNLSIAQALPLRVMAVRMRQIQGSAKCKCLSATRVTRWELAKKIREFSLKSSFLRSMKVQWLTRVTNTSSMMAMKLSALVENRPKVVLLSLVTTRTKCQQRSFSRELLPLSSLWTRSGRCNQVGAPQA